MTLDSLSKILLDRSHDLERKRITHIARQRWSMVAETEAKLEENALIRKQLTKEETNVTPPPTPAN